MLVSTLSVLILALVGFFWPRTLRWLSPNSWLSRWCRWALLPGSKEVENAAAYLNETHHYLVAQHKRLGDVFKQRRRGKTILFVRSARGVRDVLLSADFGKGDVTLTAYGTDEARRAPKLAEYVHNLMQPLIVGPRLWGKTDVRTLLGPHFGGSNAFAQGFAAEVERALDAWPPAEVVDVLTLVHDAMRGALYHAIAGDAADVLHTAATPAFTRALDYFVARYQLPDHEQAVTPEDERMMAALYSAATAVVAQLRARCAPASSAPLPRQALIAIMLHAGFSDESCAAVVVNTVIAGAEAPASSLAHTLVELAKQPELQARLRAEVADAGWAAVVAAVRGAGKGIASDAGGKVTAALDSLPLGKACVLEGLRLYAPATLVKRCALRDTHCDGVFVPKGTVVELCITAIHLDPNQFEEPTVFDPDRKGNTAAPILSSHHAYMPFSGGMRGCPGRPLALTMMRVALTAILHRFHLEWPTTVHAESAGCADTARIRKFILWPVEGLPLRVQKTAYPIE